MVVMFVAFAIMLILLFGGVLVGSALGIGFFVALVPLVRENVFYAIGSGVFYSSTGFLLVAVPLFILMSDLLVSSGLSDILYDATTEVVYGIIPGGLLQVNIAVATIFAALCGSSTAGAAALGRLAYQEVAIKRGYDRAITIGTLTAGGTLGILIPPSIPMIVYGSFAEVSVSDLFMAGIVPGVLLAFLFSVLVLIRVKRNPSLVGGFAGKLTAQKRLKGAIRLIPFGLMILAVLGSIYFGVATPTEAAGVGCIAAIILMFAFRLFSWKAVWSSLVNSSRLTSLIFFLVIAAILIGQVLAYYRVPPLMKVWAASMSPFTVVMLICFIYLVLGCFFDGLSLLLITLPFILPVAMGAGLDLYWLGILIVILVQIGMLTPPVGMNLFVMQGVTGEPINLIIRGGIPFLIPQVILCALLIAFPQLPFVLFAPTH